MKIISPTILVLFTIICLNACSQDNGKSASTNFDSLITNNSENTIQTAIVDTVIDPITIQVKLDNQQTIIKLIGLTTPGFDVNPEIYDSALKFTKFHLHKNKEVRLLRDRYNMSEAIQLSYLFVDGEMYNKLMLTSGYAIVSNTPDQFEYKEEFQSIEQEAQDSSLGYWQNSKSITNRQQIEDKQFNQKEPAGTLPKINITNPSNQKCDYAQDNTPVIKANNDKKTGDKNYYLPNSIFYKTIEIREEDGDKLFCSEIEAQNSGWVKSNH